jgi:cell division protein FtsI (penicillin-binding protein 3)
MRWLANKANAGSVVVLDVQTGEVLALANYPSYLPGKRQNLSGAQLRNRALTDTFEPGSTMKPFVIALALEKGLVTPTTPIQTAPGRLTIAGSTISDAHPHGVLTVSEVIQKSSNVGTVKLAMQMQPREMWDMYSQVGFGQKPLAVPWRGQWPSPCLQGLAADRAGNHELRLRPVGQPVSAGHAYSVFARDGDLVPVTMLKTEERTGRRARHVCTSCADVRNMLHLVTGPEGTAPKAQTMGYSVGGKTGTAHKQEGKGYADKKYRGLFVGIAPVDNPRIVVAVMIDEPSNGKYFGGDVAAPVFQETVQQTLRCWACSPT